LTYNNVITIFIGLESMLCKIKHNILKISGRKEGSSTNNNDENAAALRKIPSKEPEIIVPVHKRLGAELIGTFALVFTAVGSDVSDALNGHTLGKFAVAVAPGLVIMAMIYGLDRISGAYFNPAISIGFAITRHLKLKDLPFYIIVQIIGSILASFFVFTIIGQSGHSGLTLPSGRGGWFQSFVLEIVLTFLLMIVSISMKEEVGYKTFGGVAIGGIIALAGIVGIQISGASMNPARSFGPALITGNLSFNWIYWIAPIIGSLIAVFAFRVIKK
jgi:MIP family channel proteins